jgi:hypothetical protein
LRFTLSGICTKNDPDQNPGAPQALKEQHGDPAHAPGIKT